MSIFAIPTILKLKQVSRIDYVPIETIFDNRLNELSETYNDVTTYTEIPAKFTTLESHPLKTNLTCWNCDRTFDNRPWFVPTSVREDESSTLEFSCNGNFCSANCTLSWINLHYRGDIKNTIVTRLQHICKIFYGKIVPIQPAPSKTIQKKYGGDKDSAQFNEMMQAINIEHTAGPVVPERCRKYDDSTNTVWTLLK